MRPPLIHPSYIPCNYTDHWQCPQPELSLVLHAVDGAEDPVAVEPALHQLALVAGAVRKPHHPDTIWQALATTLHRCTEITCITPCRNCHRRWSHWVSPDDPSLSWLHSHRGHLDIVSSLYQRHFVEHVTNVDSAILHFDGPRGPILFLQGEALVIRLHNVEIGFVNFILFCGHSKIQIKRKTIYNSNKQATT